MIEALDDFEGFHPRSDLAQPDDVGEEDGCIVVMIGNIAFAVSKPKCDFGRKNVSQQGVDLPFCFSVLDR